MNKNIVLYLGPLGFLSDVRECFDDNVDVITCQPTEKDVEKNIEHTDAIIDASMNVRFSQAVLEKAKNLIIVSTATTGSDHIDAEYLARRGIGLHTLREDQELLKTLTPAAEHSWMLLMGLARQTVSAHKHVIDGNWDRTKFPGVLLKGKTLGLIGCGRIGQWMSRYGSAFGMQIIGYDPYLKEWPQSTRSVGLDELFRESDFISIHVHLSEETKNLVGEEQLKQVSPGAMLINTSRGEVLDDVAVIEALDSGRLGGLAADVLMGEPDIGNNILVKYARTNSKILLTPHCGGYSPDALKIVCRRAAEKVRDRFREEEP